MAGEFHKLLNAVAEGKAGVQAIWDYQAADRAKFPSYAYHLNFTSNHDENSWNGTEFERMGELAEPLWVVAATFEGAPLVYSGQEEPLKRRLAFFEKDDIGFRDFKMAPVFRRFLQLKHANAALWNGEAGAVAQRVTTEENNDRLLAFTRAKGDAKVVVLVNLENKLNPITLTGGFTAGEYYDVLTGDKQALNVGSHWQLRPHQYRVFSSLAPDGAERAE